MIYATIVILLMILSILGRIIVTYFGITEMKPMMDYMNNLIMIFLLIKSSIVLLNFILGELKHEKPNFTG